MYCVESKDWTPRHESGFRNDGHRTGQKEQDSGHCLENSSLCLGELLTELGTGFLKPTLSSWQKMCSRSRSHLCKQSRSQNFLPLTYQGGNLICWGFFGSTDPLVLGTETWICAAFPTLVTVLYFRVVKTPAERTEKVTPERKKDRETNQTQF